MASGILIVLASIIFADGLFIFITVLVTKSYSVPSFFGYSFLNVRTQSMTKVYPVGTVVITKRTDTASLKKGDIISFYSQDPAIKGIPNTHRIYSIEKKNTGEVYFITKGDNNDVPDQYPVYSKNIIGIVIGSIGSLGNILSFLNNRYVLFFAIILPLAVIIILEVKNTGKIIKGKNREPDEEDQSKDESEVNP